MTTAAICESGMTFGPYPEGHCFYIEKSAAYRKIQGHGVKMAEFMLIHPSKVAPSTVWIVEAKSSVPGALDAEVEAIRAKLTNAFLLGMAMCLQRHPQADADLPALFRQLNHSETGFRFVWVIKGVPDFHLPVLQDALTKAMRPVVKTWALPPVAVAVLNETGAAEHGLIVSAPAPAAFLQSPHDLTFPRRP